MNHDFYFPAEADSHFTKPGGWKAEFADYIHRYAVRYYSTELASTRKKKKKMVHPPEYGHPSKY